MYTPLVLNDIFSASKFLRYVLDHAQPDTSAVIIVCLSKEDFLHRLLAEDGNDLDELTTPTLALLKRIEGIRTLFCPTLQHLRALLASSSLLDSVAVGSILAILNPITLHYEGGLGGQYSAQGISRTFAATIDMAANKDVRLVVCDIGELESEEVEGHQTRSTNVWDEEVPLLNHSLGFANLNARSGAVREEVTNLTGRKIAVKHVLSRWCVFQSV